MRSVPEGVAAPSIIPFQDDIHYAAGARGGEASAGATPLPLKLIHDGLDERLLNMRRVGPIERLAPVRRLQLQRLIAERREGEAAFRAEDLNRIFVDAAGKVPGGDAQSPGRQTE